MHIKLKEIREADDSSNIEDNTERSEVAILSPTTMFRIKQYKDIRQTMNIKTTINDIVKRNVEETLEMRMENYKKSGLTPKAFEGDSDNQLFWNINFNLKSVIKKTENTS